MRKTRRPLDMRRVSENFAAHVAEFGIAKTTGKLSLTLHFKDGVPLVAEYDRVVRERIGGSESGGPEQGGEP